MGDEGGLESGKKRARQIIEDAIEKQRTRYGLYGKRMNDAASKTAAEATVMNQRALAQAMNIDPSNFSRKLGPRYPERFDEREIEILSEQLDLTDAQRRELRGCYGYEAPAGSNSSPPAPPPAALEPSPTPTNLPVLTTSFVGRQWELGQLRRELSKAGLLTLTGAGGCGKTRLALEFARTALHEYPHGVWFVDLSSLTEDDAALVPLALATVLGVRERPEVSLTDVIVDHLKDQRALVLLDNCEHLASASALLAGALIQGAPEVTVLATSRGSLGVAAERTWRLPPLVVPDERATRDPRRLAQLEAVRLFIERARLGRPGFEVGDENAPAVVAICRQLDGIPLALELAAARIRMLSAEQLAARLGERFTVLGRPSLAPRRRQQTLEWSIDWSHDLLSDRERCLFRRLAVFSGGWTLRQAEAIGAGDGIEPGAVLDLLENLVDASLVVADGAGSDEARFRMLEMVRDYAAGKLRAAGEATALHQRHRDWCLGFVRPVEAALLGPDQARVLDEVEQQRENVRAALRFAAGTADTQSELLLAVGMWKFWQVRGYLGEGRRALSEAIARGERADARLRATALSAAGILSSEQGDLDNARALMEQSLTLRRQIGDQPGTARSLHNLGRIARMQSDWQTADALWEQSLNVRRELNDWQGVADSLTNRGIVAAKRGDYPSARRRFTTGMRLLRRLKDDLRLGMALDNLGSVETEQGNYQRARELHDRSLEIARTLEARSLIAAEYDALGRIAWLESEFTLARSLHEQSLALHQQLADTAGIAASQRNLAAVALSLHDVDHARDLCMKSLASATTTGDREGAAEALVILARVAAYDGDHGRAETLYQESLALCRQASYRLGSIACLEGLAALAAGRQHWEQAARLFAAAAASREAMGTPLPPRDRTAQAEVLALLRDRLGDGHFATIQAEGRTLSLEEAAAAPGSPAPRGGRRPR